MVILYKFKLNEENIEKMKKRGYKLKEVEGTKILYKPKKVSLNSDLVEFSTKLFNNQEYIKIMNMLGVNFADYGLTYEDIIFEDGTQGKILIENDSFKKQIVNFEMYIDITDDCILSLTGKNEVYPMILQSKEILDKYYKTELSRLKEMDLIEEIEVSEEEGE